MRLILLGVLIFTAGSAYSLDLAGASRSDFKIAIQSGAGETEKFAASELQKYLHEITGAEFLIVTSEQGQPNQILIRAVERPDLPRVPIPDNEDTYTITVTSDRIDLVGQTPRAALFAVYGLLERLGCRWFAPAFSFYQEIGNEDIPQKAILSLAPETLVAKPSFPYRAMYIEEGKSHTNENLRQLLDWMAKARCNILCCPRDFGRSKWDTWREAVIPEAQKRGILLQVGGHGYYNYLRPEQYFHDHPDWFGMIGGKRTEDKSVVFNTSNPEAMAAIAANVVKYLKAHPEIRIFNFWPPDVARWSEDPQSLAQGSPEARHAFVLKYVRQAIHDAGLPVMLEAIAYAKCLNYPVGVQIPSDIMIDICPISRSYEFSADDPSSPANVPYVNAFRQWKENFPGIINIYSYYRKYSWISKPVNLVTRLPYEAKYYHSLGAQGISSYSEPGDWFTYEYEHYLLASLLWDVNQDAKALLPEYCTHRYGAAGADIADYYTLLEPVVTGCWTLPATKPKDQAGLKALLAEEIKARSALEHAQSVLGNDPKRLKALDRLEIDLEYVEKDLEICSLSLAGDRAGILTQLNALQAFFEANSDNGVILKAGYQAQTGGIRRSYAQFLKAK